MDMIFAANLSSALIGPFNHRSAISSDMLELQL